MAHRKLQKMISYHLTPQASLTEHEALKEELNEGWDVVQFQVNGKDDSIDTVLVTVLLEHTSKTPESQW